MVHLTDYVYNKVGLYRINMSRHTCTFVGTRNTIYIGTIQINDKVNNYTPYIYNLPFSANAGINSGYTGCFNTKSEAKDVTQMM